MRTIWTGTIGFGLINIPVKLYSAIEESSLDLDMLDAKDHEHIRFKRVNEKTGKEVAWENIVKAYDYNGEYVVLEDEDFEAASPEKTKLIQIENFVEIADIDTIYFESPYYLAPAKGGDKAYVLLQKTLEKTAKAGLGRFVFRTKEHMALIMPRDKYLVLQRLRFAQEIRNTSEIDVPAGVRITKQELDMAAQLVKQYTSGFDISKYKDEYTAELMKTIKAKASGKKRSVKPMRVVHTAGTDLFEQLKASIAGGNGKKPTTPRKKRAS
ncbi:DNA end-binding protein Ku [Chitinophaga skermanii]|uniref:Non-homologous end joining protein Ku n=1 Tax=Chitinophaga skermanii TaxID=331697 RepID=A0A327QDC6_9BACT|nr:Ku protein [Chitinophaga skermanii]RAJ01632.1 DNA end-binding protein Ku [Chitinophaga skermanii]